MEALKSHRNAPEGIANSKLFTMLCMFLIGLNLCFIKYAMLEIHSCIICQNLTSYVYEESHSLKPSNLKNVLMFSLPKDVCLVPDKQAAFKLKHFEQVSDDKSSWLSYVAYFSKKVKSFFSKECLLCSKKKKILSVHCSNPFYSDALTKLIYGSSVQFNLKDAMCYIPQSAKNSEKKPSIMLENTFDLNKDLIDRYLKQLTSNSLNSSKILKNNTLKCFKKITGSSINSKNIRFTPILNHSSAFDVCTISQNKKISYLKKNNKMKLIDFNLTSYLSRLKKSATRKDYFIHLKKSARWNDYRNMMTNFKFKTIKFEKLDKEKLNDSCLPNVCFINESWSCLLTELISFSLHNMSLSSLVHSRQNNISLNHNISKQNMSLSHDIYQISCIDDGIPKFDLKNVNAGMFVKNVSLLKRRLTYKYIYKFISWNKVYIQRIKKHDEKILITGDTINGFLIILLLNFIITFGKINPVKIIHETTLVGKFEKSYYHGQKAEMCEEPFRKLDWRKFDLELLVAIVEISNITPRES